MAENWYVVHTKPRQETRALENLQRQAYECYLPLISSEYLKKGQLTLHDEPLFPRYLFIRLADTQNWSPIRSTKGVNCIVSFGGEVAKVKDELVAALRTNELGRAPDRLFNAGDTVQIESGPFAGLKGIYQMADGEARALILIQLINHPSKIPFELKSLRKVS